MNTRISKPPAGMRLEFITRLSRWRFGTKVGALFLRNLRFKTRTRSMWIIMSSPLKPHPSIPRSVVSGLTHLKKTSILFSIQNLVFTNPSQAKSPNWADPTTPLRSRYASILKTWGIRKACPSPAYPIGLGSSTADIASLARAHRAIYHTNHGVSARWNKMVFNLLLI
jgi:hypothetical protein